MIPSGADAEHVRQFLAGAQYWAAHPVELERIKKATDALAGACERAEKAYSLENWATATEEYRAGLTAMEEGLAGADAELRRRAETGGTTSRHLVNAWYNLACCLARRAEQTGGADRESLLGEALHALGESLRLGFDDLAHVREDRDLALLHGRKEFDDLIAPK